jgi:hypothetical protein
MPGVVGGCDRGSIYVDSGSTDGSAQLAVITVRKWLYWIWKSMMTTSRRSRVGAKHCSILGDEGWSVHWPICHEGSNHPVISQGSHEGEGFPMPVRRVASLGGPGTSSILFKAFVCNPGRAGGPHTWRGRLTPTFEPGFIEISVETFDSLTQRALTSRRSAAWSQRHGTLAHSPQRLTS